MKPFVVKKKFIPRGRVTIPGDKSIAHRALIISALTSGNTSIKNFPVHDDSLATLGALAALGVSITRRGSNVLVRGTGKLKKPRGRIFADNSGTTLRLMLGVLAGTDFASGVYAGKYLSRRPMARVNVPLRMMGAGISAARRQGEEYPPLRVIGGPLKGITYKLPVASAQVKSAILLAGLSARGKTRVIEKVPTRDHTERMLKFFGAGITVGKGAVTLDPRKKLSSPGLIYIPGDISSAAFLAVLAALIPGSRITIAQVCLNPTRCGILDALKRMGAKIRVSVKKPKLKGSEPRGDLSVTSGRLKGIVVEPEEVPLLIDELPVLMVAACFAEGSTIIKGIGELRFKETDRINSMITNLRSMGADAHTVKCAKTEAVIINGRGFLEGSRLQSFGDHRTAMSVLVAALAANGVSRIDDISCINKSFPGFLAVLNKLSRGR
jgi:3-phosphoshikimate 1-carboxyvinyltransferase